MGIGICKVGAGICGVVTGTCTTGWPTLSRAVVVMGVSGSGKTTVGRLLAERLGWEFVDADSYHPPENVAKMARGVPLDDGDRAPWLERLARLMEQRMAEGRSLVLACSALKRDYRKVLRQDDPRVTFVYLQGTFELIRSRMEHRSGHYMKSELLRSQFADLEEPHDAVTLDVTAAPDELARQAEAALDQTAGG